MSHKIEQTIELLILSLLVIFRLMDLIGVLPGDLDYFMKVISWAAMGYLFVKVSLSSILFGNKNIRFDISAVFAYFLLTVKDLMGNIQVAGEEAVLVREFYNFMSDNMIVIEKYSFYLGGMIILFLALYAALKLEIKKPSFMSILHETGRPNTINKFILRSITSFIVLTAFFIAIFNLVTEWLGVVLDAPLTLIAILFYIFVVVRHHERFSPGHLIHKIGEGGDEFYDAFIKTFHSKKTLYLGITGILALHLLTDVGNFIIPYIIGVKGEFYFGHLGEGHDALLQLFKDDILAIPKAAIPFISLTYIFNMIAMVFLLALPAFVWYKFFKKRLLHVSRTTLALVFSSLLSFALTPLFYVRSIDRIRAVGADILTQSALSSSSIIDFLIKDRLTAIITAVSLAVALGAVIWALEFNKKIEKDFFIIAVIAGLVFFGFYIFHYFYSTFSYYISMISFLLKSSEFFLSLYFMLFALITIALYIGGYIFFIYEVFKRHWFRFSDKYLK